MLSAIVDFGTAVSDTVRAWLCMKSHKAAAGAFGLLLLLVMPPKATLIVSGRWQ
jgi:hypothetical protein